MVCLLFIVIYTLFVNYSRLIYACVIGDQSSKIFFVLIFEHSGNYRNTFNAVIFVHQGKHAT